jgi:transcriptional regulator of heat shock response
MLNVSNLTKIYGKTVACNNLSFHLERGSITVLLGPNGAGKSTLLKSIVGFLRYGGDVRVAGVDHLLQYPEYNDHERLRDMLGMLESKENLLSLLPAEGSGNDVGVYIGSESGLDVMSNSTFVYRTVQKNGKVVGAIGVIGPCRMDYSKVIGIINHLTENIDSVINSDDIENK